MILFVQFLPAILAGAGALGKLFSGGAQGAASERGSQNAARLQTANLGNQVYNTQQGAATSQYGIGQSAATHAADAAEQGALSRASLGLQAPGVRARQALLGSLLQNAHSTSVTPPPGVRMGTITGGLNPDSLLSSLTRSGGADLERNALDAIRSGSDVPPPTDFQSARLQAPGLLAPPKAPEYAKAGGLETTMSTVGILAQLLGAIGAAKYPQSGGGFDVPNSGSHG